MALTPMSEGEGSLESNRPLQGFRVLDLTRVFSGPYCTQMLSELGAEVIKVESPEGDETRKWLPYIKEESNYFFTLNRSKRSIVVNLRDPRGQEIVHKLAAEADVVVENFTPGVSKRLGVDYERLKAIKPDLVYLSISGFGQDGPYRNRKAYDPVAQALSGIMGLTGDPDGPPAKTGVAVGDIAPAMYAVSAILAALLWRERTGKGQYIDVAMLDCAVSWLTVQAAIFLATGRVPNRTGTTNPSRAPSSAYLTRDGRYVHCTMNDTQWVKFCELVGLAELGHDPRLSTNKGRLEHYEEVMSQLRAAMKLRTAEEWDRILGEAGIPCGVVYRVDEVFADPQVVHREMVSTFDFPGLGPVKALRNPIRYRELDTSIKSRPPMLGEHSREVLAHLGFTEEQIAELFESGVVACADEETARARAANLAE